MQNTHNQQGIAPDPSNYSSSTHLAHAASSSENYYHPRASSHGCLCICRSRPLSRDRPISPSLRRLKTRVPCRSSNGITHQCLAQSEKQQRQHTAVCLKINFKLRCIRRIMPQRQSPRASELPGIPLLLRKFRLSSLARVRRGAGLRLRPLLQSSDSIWQSLEIVAGVLLAVTLDTPASNANDTISNLKFVFRIYNSSKMNKYYLLQTIYSR